MKILVTGGCGYVGSHTVLVLLNASHEVVIIDNLSNSSANIIQCLMNISGKEIHFINGDVRDKACLDKIFSEHSIGAVMHFAGLKSVNESIHNPVGYYDVNVGGSMSLLLSMKEAGVNRIVFSSSATVYGEATSSPCKEIHGRGIISNPYGESKAIVERILEDQYKADPHWKIIILRYFNPVGAEPGGQIGENPNGTPNNLMPLIIRAASGHLNELTVFGADYSTPDGSCRRDFIHVMDLANGHLQAIEKIDKLGFDILNLGTGIPHSVFEMVNVFESVNRVKVPYKIGSRRDGDLADVYADPSRANTVLDWVAVRDLGDMVRDSWFAYKNAQRR